MFILSLVDAMLSSSVIYWKGILRSPGREVTTAVLPP